MLSSWWKEYAECSEGPIGRPSSSKMVDKQLGESSPEGARSAQLYEAEEERVGVPVKGGLYEVLLLFSQHDVFMNFLGSTFLNEGDYKFDVHTILWSTEMGT